MNRHFCNSCFIILGLLSLFFYSCIPQEDNIDENLYFSGHLFNPNYTKSISLSTFDKHRVVVPIFEKEKPILSSAIFSSEDSVSVSFICKTLSTVETKKELYDKILSTNTFYDFSGSNAIIASIHYRTNGKSYSTQIDKPKYGSLQINKISNFNPDNSELLRVEGLLQARLYSTDMKDSIDITNAAFGLSF